MNQKTERIDILGNKIIYFFLNYELKSVKKRKDATDGWGG